jgi:hypothetical protein
MPAGTARSGKLWTLETVLLLSFKMAISPPGFVGLDGTDTYNCLLSGLYTDYSSSVAFGKMTLPVTALLVTLIMDTYGVASLGFVTTIVPVTVL